MKTKHTLVALSVALFTMTGTGFAADGQDDSWRFGVAVPLWAPQINGDATVRGHQQDVNVSFSQLKDHLDASFALALDARKGKFDIYGDFGYMKFSVGSGGVSDDLKFVVADGGVAYQLVKTGEKLPFILEATAGIRYWGTWNKLTLRGPRGELLFSASGNQNLVDPVIGLRGSQFLTSKLHLDFAGDFGGFDISHDTDWTWSATAMVTYDFAKWFSLSAGYKALAVDESNGSGASKNGVNLIFNGVLVVAKFTF